MHDLLRRYILCDRGLRDNGCGRFGYEWPAERPHPPNQYGARFLAYGVHRFRQATGEGPRNPRRRNTSETSASLARRTWRPVRRFVERVVAFLKWLFTSEQLPASSGDFGEPPPRGRGLEHWLFGKERLAEESSSQTSRIQRRAFLTWVLSQDQLHTVDGRSLQAPEHRQSFWSWLLGGGELPSTRLPENQERSQGGFFRSLLSSETLAGQPEKALAGRQGFVRWLLSRETL